MIRSCRKQCDDEQFYDDLFNDKEFFLKIRISNIKWYLKNQYLEVIGKSYAEIVANEIEKTNKKINFIN